MEPGEDVKLKIVYVITKADEIGGAQVHVRDLSVLAQKDNHEVTVIVGEPGRLVCQLQKENVPVIIVPELQRDINIIKDIKCIYKLHRIIDRLDPDLITLHSSKAGVVGRVVAKLLKKKVIFTAHGWAFADGVNEKRKKLYIKIEKTLTKFTNKIITVSEQDKKLALENGVACGDRQIVIHNGVHNQVSSAIYNRDNNIVRLVMVARFSEQKDHETLLQALAGITHLPWTLDLVGKGPNLDSIAKLANKLNLGDRVNFLGERDDVPDILYSSDIFLLISNWEGYPLSILEAMGCGLPIIASDVGGVSEAVVNEKNGYLISRKDIKNLESCLSILIEDRDLRRKISTINSEEFMEKHSVESMYRKTMNVYNEVLSI
uniref:WbwZ protein n=1 Tax=Vibrio parahaemolyticus TaxID=670 RepID=A0A5Q5AWR4_VIBPH|nr:WbwZ protein [Vibrio parahaemolyticus]QOS24158.1 O-antigen biosynthesis glycosyltransferase WbnH [Vibrio parahaemolyticus]